MNNYRGLMDGWHGDENEPKCYGYCEGIYCDCEDILRDKRGEDDYERERACLDG